MRLPSFFERGSWAIGVALLAFYLAARWHDAAASEADLARFEQLRQEEVDFSLWADGRIEAYRESLKEELDLPMGVLRIPRIELEVPIHGGIDELVLNRAVGWIPGTTKPGASEPGQGGNVGIAGHRDGFFRGLKDLGLGDIIEIETLSDSRKYVVEGTLIVEPKDVWVLGPTSDQTITLVTCYPFYHVGKAPKRYIVKAVLATAEGL